MSICNVSIKSISKLVIVFISYYNVDDVAKVGQPLVDIEVLAYDKFMLTYISSIIMKLKISKKPSV